MSWDRSLRPGPRFRQVIAQQLAEAKCVVVLWSTLSVDSEFVFDEAEPDGPGNQHGQSERQP